MHCPFCSANDTRVIDSRSSRDGDVIRRRRLCESCKGRFTTYEKIEIMLPMIVKKDQSRVPFEREKVMRGLQQACRKRPISVEMMEDLTTSLEKHLRERGEKEVESTQLGEWILAALRDLDEVAYVRFASVYRDFRNAEEFMTELRSLMARQGG